MLDILLVIRKEVDYLSAIHLMSYVLPVHFISPFKKG